MRKLDLPPIWLLAFLAVAYGSREVMPSFSYEFMWLKWLGAVVAGLGLAIMTAAVWEFLQARTTVIPRQTPSAFLHRGIYRLSRNPIYLGDVLLLAGAILWWGMLPGLILVPLFIALINNRFIHGEEAVLREEYAERYSQWAAKVRRWI